MDQPGTEETIAHPVASVGQLQEEEDPGLVGLLDLFVPLIQRRRLIVLCTLAGLLLGVLWTLRKGVYVATTTVLPPQASVSTSLLGQIGNLAGMVGNSGLGMPHGSQELYVSLMQSPSVQDAVVRRFSLDKVYEEAPGSASRAALSRHCTIDGANRDGMLRVIVSDPDDSGRAADIANGYVDEFIKFMGHLAVGEAAQRRLFFDQQMQKERSALTDAEENLRKTEQKTGTIEISAQTRVLLEAAATLRAQVAAKEVEVGSLRAYAGPDNVKLQRAQNELAGLRSELTRVSNSNGDAGDSMAISRSSLPQTALDNIRAQRDIKYHEAIFGILSNQYEAARLDEAREGAPVQVVERATVPEARSSRPAVTKIMIGSLLGLFLSVFYILAAYAWQRMRANRMFAGKLNDLHDAYLTKA